MVSDLGRWFLWAVRCGVLILVLMEYGLWLIFDTNETTKWVVLILVLMEYGLWPKSYHWLVHWSRCLNPCSNGIWSLTDETISSHYPRHVLILVLMEYGLWPFMRESFGFPAWSLNPCSNGIWSLTRQSAVYRHTSQGLNPCSNGIWSLTSDWWRSWCT